MCDSPSNSKKTILHFLCYLEVVKDVPRAASAALFQICSSYSELDIHRELPWTQTTKDMKKISRVPKILSSILQKKKKLSRYTFLWFKISAL